MNLMLAHEEVRRQNANAWAILLDANGNLSEGVGSNIFLVDDGVIFTPEDRYVLCGVSRQTAIDLAEAQGLKVVRTDLDLYDAYTADENFLANSIYQLLPVGTVDNRQIGGVTPGPISKQLLAAWSEMVGMDIVGQSLRQAGR